MEQKSFGKRKTIFAQDKAYFHSETYINVEATDVKEILSRMIYEVLKEVINLEIHTVDYKPMKGFSFIPLPDFIMRKKTVIINVQNKDNKCFLWSVLRYLQSKSSKNRRC